jgi:hypothetical protein
LPAHIHSFHLGGLEYPKPSAPLRSTPRFGGYSRDAKDVTPRPDSSGASLPDSHIRNQGRTGDFAEVHLQVEAAGLVLRSGRGISGNKKRPGGHPGPEVWWRVVDRETTAPKLMKIGTDCCLSSTEQSSGQQGLHIPPSIDDEIDDDLPAHDAVDHPVGLEHSLAVFLDAQSRKFFWITATLWKPGQTFYDPRIS